MDLDRGILARLDRKLLAGLGHDETYRMVRVPVTASRWSTWRRYCESTDVSMGRALVTLIDRELVSMFGDQSGDHLPVLSEQAEKELARRREQVARREEKAAAVEARLSAWNAHLRAWEVELRSRRTASRVRSEDGRASQGGEDQGRSKRTMPVRIGPQVQALPRPTRPMIGGPPR